MAQERIQVLSFKLPASLGRKLTRAAAARGMSRSALLREAAERIAAEADPRPTFGSLAADLMGCIEGPGDLSTNPRHMLGFGGGSVKGSGR